MTCSLLPDKLQQACHAIIEVFEQQGIQLKNAKNYNLPVNDGWVVYKRHGKISISGSFC